MAKTTNIAAAFGMSLMLAVSAPAFAQDAAKADDHRLDEAWEDVLETEGEILVPGEFDLLTNIAYQMAAARVCDTHSLDKEALSVSVLEVLDGTGKELTQEQLDELRSAVLISLGARYGLFIAEAHVDKAAFCTSVEDLVKSPDGTKVFLK